MNTMRYELRRAFVNPLFVLTVGIQILFLYLGGIEDWPYAKDLDSFYMFAVSQEFGAAHLFVPIMVMLPYGLSLIQELNTGYTLFQLHRSGRRDWVVGKIIAVILSGATAVALGTLLYAGACILLAPDNSYRVEVWRSYADGHWLEPYLRNNYGIPYMFLSVFLCFLSGLVWSCVGLLLINKCSNAVIVLILSESIFLLCTRVPLLKQFIDPIEMLQPTFFSDQYTLTRIVTTQLSITAVILVCTIWLMFRKSHNLALYKHNTIFKKVTTTTMNWLQISPIVLLLFVIMALLRPIIFIGNRASSGTMLLSLVGGLEYNEQPSVADLAQWILLWSPCFVHVGLITQHEFSNYMLIKIYRYGGEDAWIRNTLKRSIFPCIAYILLAVGWIVCYAQLQNVSGWTIIAWMDDGTMIDLSDCLIWILPTLCLHAVFLCVLQICIALYMKKAHIGAFVTLVLTMGSIWFAREASDLSAYALGNMGMVMRISEAGGAPSHPIPVMFFEVFCVFILIILTLVRAQHYNQLNKVR